MSKQARAETRVLRAHMNCILTSLGPTIVTGSSRLDCSQYRLRNIRVCTMQCSTGKLYYLPLGIPLNAMSSTLLVRSSCRECDMTRRIPTCLFDGTCQQPVIFAESGPLTCCYKINGVPPSAPGPKDTWRCASVRHGNFVEGCDSHVQKLCVSAWSFMG